MQTLKILGSAESTQKNAESSLDSANRVQIAESNLSCHSERNEVERRISKENHKRDSSVVTLPQNDKVSDFAESSAFYYKISTYAILCIAFLICVFNPYALYATDITQFDSTQTMATLGALFGVFLTASFIVIYAVSFVPKRFAKIPAFVFSLTLFIGLIYSFILVGDYGAMDHFILQKPPENSTQQILNFIAVLAIGVIFIALLLKKLLRVWQIILITLFAVSAINATNIALQRIASHKSTAILNSKSPPPLRLSAPYANELFSYSKTQKNIVVIVLDMFSGTHTPHILEQFPHLKTQLDGFMHFPNAVSTTDSTIHSVATLIGGEYYAVYKMNARGVNLKSEIESAFKSTANAFAAHSFEVALIAYTDSKIQNLIAPNIFALDSASEIFVPYYGAQLGLTKRIHRAKSINNRNIIGQLIAFGIFKVAPTLFKMGIYNDGIGFLARIGIC